MTNKSITLIELLIAISLLTLILLAGSGIYLSGWQMFNNAQLIAQAQRNAMIPMAHMVKHLQMATSFSRIEATSTTPLQLQFSINTSGTTSTERYIFNRNNSNQIEYDVNTSTGGEQTIGRQIVFGTTNPTTFIVSPNRITVNITIIANDNRRTNPYTLSSTIEARYGATPPI